MNGYRPSRRAPTRHGLDDPDLSAVDDKLDVRVRQQSGLFSVELRDHHLTLRPVSLRDYRRHTPREVERIRRIVTANREQLLRQWHEFFDQTPR